MADKDKEKEKEKEKDILVSVEMKSPLYMYKCNPPRWDVNLTYSSGTVVSRACTQKDIEMYTSKIGQERGEVKP